MKGTILSIYKFSLSFLEMSKSDLIHHSVVHLKKEVNSSNITKQRQIKIMMYELFYEPANTTEITSRCTMLILSNAITFELVSYIHYHPSYRPLNIWVYIYKLEVQLLRCPFQQSKLSQSSVEISLLIRLNHKLELLQVSIKWPIKITS